MAVKYLGIRLRRAECAGILSLALAALGAAPTQGQTKEIVLHAFASYPHGREPIGELIRGPAGNLYGVTSYGGAAGAGVVFKLNTSGEQRVLYSFTGGADGGGPTTDVVRDSAGNLYGATGDGGTSRAGVVYKLDPVGNETVLYSFTGGSDGGNPDAGLIRDSAGNLYGTTGYGGTGKGFGVVYKLDAAGNETVLYSFTGGADGGNPVTGVIRDSGGNLYGTTLYGGIAGFGVVYKLDAAGNETVLHSFTGGADGSYPFAGVIRDSAGNLYGTAQDGGTGHGVVYKLDPAGNYTALYSFTGGADGSQPYAGVIRDSAGNLYGTASYGGTEGDGVIYKLDAAGNYTVLHSFTGGADGDGSEPDGAMTRDSAGNLYGTASQGGTGGVGVIYEMDAAGQETVLYNFSPPAKGASPGAVIRDSAGNLYGTAGGGAAHGTSTGAGLVYKLDANAVETVLYSFKGGADGDGPNSARLIRDSAGNLYGTAGGGTTGYGVAYKLDPAGNETVQYSFTGGADGGFPLAGVIRDSEGNLYGTTQYGGMAPGYDGSGVVYKLDAAGNETVLHSFSGYDGGGPVTGVIRDSAGNLYGTTLNGGTAGEGVVYRLDAAGNYTVLHSFTGGADGSFPYAAGVIRDSAGNLYGTALCGGEADMGVVYKLDPAGSETVLYSFMGAADGRNPPAGVIRDSAGNLYGTAQGGTANVGVVYTLDPAGNETVLHTFTGGSDGGDPYAGVISGPAGNLFGATLSGGQKGGGVVFLLEDVASP